MDVKKVLSIAGSDSSGGAGIQADLKTISAHNLYGMTVITSVTAQNTRGVYGVFDVSPEFVEKQIDAVFEDIRPDAVKIGMVSNPEIIKVISKCLKKYHPEFIVVDPVMVSTSGCMLMEEGAISTLINELLPLATIITPNIPEAEVLSTNKINNIEDMIQAAKQIREITNNAILIKGGHLTESADDLLLVQDKAKWYSQARINNHNTHGTGCTLSSAIACNLAMGYSIEKSVENGKKYVADAIRANLNLGSGDGPLWHNVPVITK